MELHERVRGLDISTVELHKQIVGASRALDEALYEEKAREEFLGRLLSNAVVSLRDSIAEDAFMLDLRSFVYGRKKEITFTTPRTWWDALKVAHAPAWFLARYPPVFDVHTVVATQVWPRVVAPDNKSHVTVAFAEYVRPRP